MKRWIHSSSLLSQFSGEQIEYVKDCLDDMSEAIDDMTAAGYTEDEQTNVISEIRSDWLLGAKEDDLLTEVEFDELLDLLSLSMKVHKYLEIRER